jgi:putative membrane protein
MVHRAIAFVHALRLQLRDQRDEAVLQRWLTAAEFEKARSTSNPADTLMLHMGRDLGECVRQGQIEPCLAVPLDATLSSLTASAASCERIKNTPVPFSYTLLLHRARPHVLLCHPLDWYHGLQRVCGGHRGLHLL